MVEAPPTPMTPRRGRRIAAALLLALLAAVLQGRSVGYGLVLDDYNHRAELRDGDWSFRSLVDASHLGDPRRRVRMWWQDEADLYFFRPLAFAIMRATYVAGEWRPEVMHLASIGWGVLCAWLVLTLAQRTTRSLGWGLLAAIVFLTHPNNFLTPRWIACQNEQMATAFTLAALLFYGRYAGWWNSADTPEKPPPSRPLSLLAATLVCYVAALGCRESAIILPALIVVGDWAAGTFSTIRIRNRDRTNRDETRRSQGAVNLRQQLAPYVMFATIAVGYLLLRHRLLGPLTIPGRPYAWPASEPGFLPFIGEKFAYYILGLWAGIPIVGFAGQEQMRQQPAFFYGVFAAIVTVWVMLLALIARRRPALDGSGSRPRGSHLVWLWLAVALLPLGPVLPVFASAHHLYLASVGMAIATVVAIRALLAWAQQRRNAIRRALRAAVVSLVPTGLLIFVGANFVLDTGVAGLAAACQLPMRQAIQLGPPLQPGDKLFFINLPMLAFNCMPAIEEARGTAPLEGHVLTFAPGFIRMDRPAHIEQIDARRLRVWLDEPAYFSGLIGQSILQGIHRNRPFQPGERFTADEFEVEVTKATEEGVQEFVFTFRRPLNDPTYHFFLSSPVFDAYPLTFR